MASLACLPPAAWGPCPRPALTSLSLGAASGESLLPRSSWTAPSHSGSANWLGVRRGPLSGLGPDGESAQRALGRVPVAQGQDRMRVGAGPDTFLSMEEAGLVELAGLDMHERFLARLTISSLNLLRVISEQEGVPIEQLNAGKICDWFLKDKQKRQVDREAAVLKWEDLPL